MLLLHRGGGGRFRLERARPASCFLILADHLDSRNVCCRSAILPRAAAGSVADTFHTRVSSLQHEHHVRRDDARILDLGAGILVEGFGPITLVALSCVGRVNFPRGIDQIFCARSRALARRLHVCPRAPPDSTARLAPDPNRRDF